jgi:HD-like signal output (HDOD) protein
VEEIAFTGSLMHDLGKVIMNNEAPESFAEVMMIMYNDGIDSIKAEEKVFGYNHTDVGSKVVVKWGLSPSLSEILAKHHLNNCKLEDLEGSSIAKSIACVNLADYVCKFLGVGYRSPDDTIQLHELPSAVFLNMPKEKLDPLIQEIKETYDNEKSVFQ